MIGVLLVSSIINSSLLVVLLTWKGALVAAPIGGLLWALALVYFILRSNSWCQRFVEHLSRPLTGQPRLLLHLSVLDVLKMMARTARLTSLILKVLHPPKVKYSRLAVSGSDLVWIHMGKEGCASENIYKIGGGWQVVFQAHRLHLV